MIEIFYKDNGQISVSQTETDFANIHYDDVLWIDICPPEKKKELPNHSSEPQSRAVHKRKRSRVHHATPRPNRQSSQTPTSLSRARKNIPWRQYPSS